MIPRLASLLLVLIASLNVAVAQYDVKLRTAGEYLEFRKKLTRDRIEEPEAFLKQTRMDMGKLIEGLSPTYDHVFSLNAEYNEAALGSLLGAVDGFPLRDEEISTLKVLTTSLKSKVSKVDDQAILDTVLSSIIAADTKNKNRLGLPSHDEELLDLQLPSDAEVLNRNVGMDPAKLLSGKKWPRNKRGINRPKEWAEIEKNPAVLTAAMQEVLLTPLGQERNKDGLRLFSDPYYALESVYVLSLAGSGVALEDDELKEFRRRSNLAAARSKSEAEWTFLNAFYALVLRADQENKKAHKSPAKP